MDPVFDMYHQLKPNPDPEIDKLLMMFLINFTNLIIVIIIYHTSFTLEYIKLNGRLIAMDNNHTNIILTITLFLDLLRPNFIGYLNDK